MTGISLEDAVLLLYLGVVSTFLGYIGWNIGLRGLGATRAVAYAYVISPLAVAFGAVLLDEPVTALARRRRRPRGRRRRRRPARALAGQRRAKPEESARAA